MKTTGDKTADFLLERIRLVRRIGEPEHRRDADRWERIIRSNARPEPMPEAVDFAQGAEPAARGEAQ